ncbi:alpha/beta fold hydrolase [Furfurilactobacillus milii]|uniref:Alpha/beta hydrolase n=1 Tax=Furfurilactobacillus milii TaxID=2888272 RepID=A0ABT6D830_9LACO|nr:alpha/beta hydrolase [Furfurilactobacillus milii]QLE66300.1 alpha-beta hydrolase [Furfurilactobacillus rossiae]MCF6159756.1 alpha/beta hydrolase [Furfurilactobacillus milii]MCF6163159.1 alpha/beta hydrolase [Furfurilactobacillus milii]MCF6419137.1 alpha/beta hydrolase [Furfurilactobacillus milii]MDF9912718.1 alpha/beta hydrolase [Furfurilactobacillus milii]
MQFITSDGVRLEYDDVGTGQPIVIMTGFAGNKEIWRSQVAALFQAHFRVINLDRRNHGQSESTAKGLRMSRQGKDLAELLDYLHLDHVDLMGNSMGAAVAWAYCSLYGDHRLRRMICVDQSPKMISDHGWPYGMLDLNWENFPEATAKMLQVHTTYKRINDETYQAVKKAQVGHRFNEQLNQPLLWDHAFQDWRDVLRQLSIPVLFVAGAHSPFWSPKHAVAAAEMTPNGASFIVPEAGHIVMAEQQERFNERMLAFLKTAVPVSAS